MKALLKISETVDRATLTLSSLLLVILMHATGCAKPTVEIPADEMTTDATEATGIPTWAPADADRRVRYYFLPEIDVYYDTYVGQYVYLHDDVWVYTATLPSIYVDFDIFSAHIVYLDYGITRPWVRNSYYIATYPTTFFYGHPGLHRGYGWRCYNEHGHKYGGNHVNIVQHNKIYYGPHGGGHGSFGSGKGDHGHTAYNGKGPGSPSHGGASKQGMMHPGAQQPSKGGVKTGHNSGGSMKMSGGGSGKMPSGPAGMPSGGGMKPHSSSAKMSSGGGAKMSGGGMRPPGGGGGGHGGGGGKGGHGH